MYRRKLKHSRVKNLFKFASQKNNASCLVESALEYDACFHFEYSPNIKSFEAQPLGFHYVYEDRKFPYTPDFLLHYNDGGQKYLEIKTAKELSKLEVKQIAIASRDLSAYPEDIQKNSTCQIQGKITNIN